MVKLVPNRENKLRKQSVIDIFQLRSVSQKRCVEKIGEISENELMKCKEAIEIVFDI